MLRLGRGGVLRGQAEVKDSKRQDAGKPDEDADANKDEEKQLEYDGLPAKQRSDGRLVPDDAARVYCRAGAHVRTQESDAPGVGHEVGIVPQANAAADPGAVMVVLCDAHLQGPERRRNA